jgi:hypothetical protein
MSPANSIEPVTFTTDQLLNFLCTANLANARVLRRFSELAWRSEQPAPEQARLNADQQRMALIHADWPQAATAGRGSNRKLSLAALPRHPRFIRVHLRHLLLICVESYLPWRATHDCAGASHSTPRAQAR